MFLLARMPPKIMAHISTMEPKPANRDQFFKAADNQFLALRLNMSLTGTLKEKVSHYRDLKKSIKFNNVQTSNETTFKCYLCNQPGHHKRNCPKLKGHNNFNRIKTEKGKNGQIVFKVQYCKWCGRERPYHTRNCKESNRYSYGGKFAKGPTPMIHHTQEKYNKFSRNNNNFRKSISRGNFRRNNNNSKGNFRKNNNNQKR